MGDRESRVVSDLNSVYLSDEAMSDIERLGIELHEGGPLTVYDYDADEEGKPAWLVAEGTASFDPVRQRWRIAYTMNDVHWEPRHEPPPKRPRS